MTNGANIDLSDAICTEVLRRYNPIEGVTEDQLAEILSAVLSVAYAAIVAQGLDHEQAKAMLVECVNSMNDVAAVLHIGPGDKPQ